MPAKFGERRRNYFRNWGERREGAIHSGERREGCINLLLLVCNFPCTTQLQDAARWKRTRVRARAQMRKERGDCEDP